MRSFKYIEDLCINHLVTLRKPALQKWRKSHLAALGQREVLKRPESGDLNISLYCRHFSLETRSKRGLPRRPFGGSCGAHFRSQNLTKLCENTLFVFEGNQALRIKVLWICKTRCFQLLGKFGPDIETYRFSGWSQQANWAGLNTRYQLRPARVHETELK